eukprot:Hpha_TRINITY_DN26017_c0_g1::TRINITY_DN26017_c0_g1_i1::g.115208::m.115208/K10393/KIF2_24, MCAK; kinesin family member 2/24
MSKIYVAVRKRPMSGIEQSKGGKDVMDIPSQDALVLNQPMKKYDLTPYTERHQFAFDRVFDQREKNGTVFKEAVSPLLETVFSKGNATCFAYGQTGSGKTHTMLGNQQDPGIYLLAAEKLFSRLERGSQRISVAFFEIYGRKIFDLLNHRKKLVAREDAKGNIVICGLSEHAVNDEGDLMREMQIGTALRAQGATSANADSSRSHAVLRIQVQSATSGKSQGTISFIDLAGNERGSDTRDCDRQTRIEGAEINKSLLALKECIRALGMGKTHVPFRGSVLTEVLRDSFLGNSRTVMIANVSPSSTNCEHTLNTLRYTDRVKGLGGGGKRVRGAAAPRRQAVPEPARPPPDEVLELVRRLQVDRGGRRVAEPPASDDDASDEGEGDGAVEAAHTHVAARLQEEEEDLVVAYRRVLDKRVELMKAEVAAVCRLDNGGVRELDSFLAQIDSCLSDNIRCINEMRDRCASVREYLRQEELLGKSFQPRFRC